MAIFTEKDRDSLRARVIEWARTDARITGGAITGSKASGHEDRWSDIDLAFGAKAESLRELLDDFSALMRAEHGAVDELDVTSGTWIYRVFLLPSTLQVDIAVAPESDFRAKAPTFTLLFGQAREPKYPPNPDAKVLIGWAWLYALHVRSCIARGKLWQAEHMLNGMRDRVLTLACLRMGLPADHGRGYDELPSELLEAVRESMASELSSSALWSALGVLLEALINEADSVNPELARRIAIPLEALSASL